jgi:hypothetical protein
LFDEDVMSTVIDQYAPKNVKRKRVTGGPGGVTMYEETVRNKEDEDSYYIALNDAKKKVIDDELMKIQENGNTVGQNAEKDLDRAMNSYLEIAKYTDGPGRKYRSAFDRFMVPKLEKKNTEDISDMLEPGYVEGAEKMLDQAVWDFVDGLEIQNEGKRTMTFHRIKDRYKSEKLLDKAKERVRDKFEQENKEVFDEASIKSDFEKISKSLNEYEEKLESVYAPYEAAAEKAKNDFKVEYAAKQDAAIRSVSNSDAYKNLLSEFQVKVESGEMSQSEAESAFNQRVNIMLAESPDLLEIEKKYQGLISSYQSRAERERDRIINEAMKKVSKLEDLSSSEAEYRKLVKKAVSDIYSERKSALESDWETLNPGEKVFTGIASGIGDMLSISSYMFGDSSVGRELTSIRNQIKSDNPLIDVGEFDGWASISNEDWWATRVAPSAPMTFSLMIPGLGVGAATSATATKLGLTGLSRALIAGTVSGTGMRAMESFTEAGMQYYDLVERGESVGYASREAAKNFKDQMGAATFDVAEMTFIFLPATSVLGTVGKFAAQIPLNAAEEIYQEEIPAEEMAYSRYLRGDLTPEEAATGITEYEKVFAGGKFSDMYNFFKTKQGKEVAAIGGIYGGAFGGASLPGDISRTNSLKRLNNFLNEEIVKYSSTEVFRTSEGKPLEFGMGGVVAGPTETIQEAKNRRIWQLKATLDEMQMKGLINEDDAKLGKKQIDFAFGVADQMPVNLPLVTRDQGS